jgi:hypothetical protein
MRLGSKKVMVIAEEEISRKGKNMEIGRIEKGNQHGFGMYNVTSVVNHYHHLLNPWKAAIRIRQTLGFRKKSVFSLNREKTPSNREASQVC